MNSLAADGAISAELHFPSHMLIRGGHAQTIAGLFWPGPRFAYHSVKHSIVLPDGDTIILHDSCPPTWSPTGRVTLLLHGLGGCHDSSHVSRLSGRLNDLNQRTFRLDFRGCGAGIGLARLPYHGGCSDDVLAALQLIVEICPGSPISMVGFSLGGNIALKLLGEAPNALPRALYRAAAVNPPIDLAASVKGLTNGLNNFYNRYFTSRLAGQVRSRRVQFPDAPGLPSGGFPRDMREFDDWYTAPVSGYGCAENYYKQCSSTQFVANIQVETLILTSQDDPLVPVEIFRDLPSNPAVTLRIASGGGHLGYIARQSDDPDRHWLDWRLLEWLRP